jgi:hypothetical protein
VHIIHHAFPPFALFSAMEGSDPWQIDSGDEIDDVAPLASDAAQPLGSLDGGEPRQTRPRGRPRKAIVEQVQPQPGFMSDPLPLVGLRPLGTPFEQSVVHHLNRQNLRTDCVPQLLLDSVLGPWPRGTAPQWCEAIAVGQDRKQFQNSILDLAAGVTFATRACVSSLASWLAHQFASKTLEPVACVTCIAYDETPLKLRAQGPQQHAARRQKEYMSVCKVFQTTLKFLLIVAKPPSKRLEVFEIPCVTPLVVADSSSAEVVTYPFEKTVGFWHMWLPAGSIRAAWSKRTVLLHAGGSGAYTE